MNGGSPENFLMLNAFLTKFQKKLANFRFQLNMTATGKFLEDFRCNLQKFCPFSMKHTKPFANLCYHFLQNSIEYSFWQFHKTFHAA